MIERIIWDKDGVIFDAEPVYCGVVRTVLARHGIEISDADYYSHWTRNGGNTIGFLENRGIVIDVGAFRREKTELLRTRLMEKVPIINGALDALERFVEYSGALVTSSGRPETDLMLDLSDFRRYFRHVVTVEDVIYSKPHPAGFLLASQRLGISPDRLLVIEDAEKGIIAAYRAGMKCIAIPNQYTADNDFSLADVVLGDIGELTLELVATL